MSLVFGHKVQFEGINALYRSVEWLTHHPCDSAASRILISITTVAKCKSIWNGATRKYMGRSLSTSTASVYTYVGIVTFVSLTLHSIRYIWRVSWNDRMWLDFIVVSYLSHFSIKPQDICFWRLPVCVLNVTVRNNIYF